MAFFNFALQNYYFFLNKYIISLYALKHIFRNNVFGGIEIQ